MHQHPLTCAIARAGIGPQHRGARVLPARKRALCVHLRHFPFAIGRCTPVPGKGKLKSNLIDTQKRQVQLSCHAGVARLRAPPSTKTPCAQACTRARKRAHSAMARSIYMRACAICTHGHGPPEFDFQSTLISRLQLGMCLCPGLQVPLI